MEKNNIKTNNVYVSEEEKTLNWDDVLTSFKKNFGDEIFYSWLQKISLVKEYNDFLILGVPTRFFRDWIVSRYLDKILEQVKSFKMSLNRIEFKIIEENKHNQELIKINEINKVTEIKDRLVEINQEINLIPENVREGLFGKWLEGARDWSISRNRFWGSPIPVWKSDNPEFPRIDVYGSLEELERDFGVRPTNLHRPFIDELTRPNPDDPSGKSIMRRVPEVLDLSLIHI